LKIQIFSFKRLHRIFTNNGRKIEQGKLSNTHFAFAFVRGLGSRSRKSSFFGAAWASCPTSGAASGELIAIGAASLDGVFREVSSTVAGEAPATRPASEAVGREIDVRSATSLDRTFREVTTAAGAALLSGGS